MKINNKLTNLRSAKGLSQYRLAQLSGVAQNHIAKIERGEAQPSINTLIKLLNALDCTLSEFFNDNGSILYLSDSEKQHLMDYRSLSFSQQEAINLYYSRLCRESG